MVDTNVYNFLCIQQKMVLAIADKHHFLRLTEKSVEMKNFYPKFVPPLCLRLEVVTTTDTVP